MQRHDYEAEQRDYEEIMQAVLDRAGFDAITRIPGEKDERTLQAVDLFQPVRPEDMKAAAERLAEVFKKRHKGVRKVCFEVIPCRQVDMHDKGAAPKEIVSLALWPRRADENDEYEL